MHYINTLFKKKFCHVVQKMSRVCGRSFTSCSSSLDVMSGARPSNHTITLPTMPGTHDQLTNRSDFCGS